MFVNKNLFNYQQKRCKIQGIPFAEPPIGDLRFTQLKDKTPWNGVLETKYYSAACPSNTTLTTSPQKNINEDCIYMNIFGDTRCLEVFFLKIYIVFYRKISVARF